MSDPAALIDDAKRSLRKEMRAIRRIIAADPADRAARSRRLWESIVDEATARLGEEPAVSAMLYSSLPTEPDTSAWFEDARRRGWTAYAPEVDGLALRVMPGDVDPATLTVVVFPGLAFTADGWRLGQGGGHYDRFATTLSATCLRVGTCFREQLVEDLPVGELDQRVDIVIAA